MKYHPHGCIKVLRCILAFHQCVYSRGPLAPPACRLRPVRGGHHGGHAAWRGGDGVDRLHRR